MKRILIVDDDVAFREGLEIVLGDYCQEIASVGGGPQALSLVHSFAPDAVLINPDGDGLELARQIKNRLPHVRVILLSLFDQYLNAALDLGADGYLLKGCPTDDLVAALDRSEPLT